MKRTSANCTHENWEPWDCGCMFGPPSCTSCHIVGKCLDCGARLERDPTLPKKANRKTGPLCEVCLKPFDGKGLLRAHRASVHGWLDGGRART